MVKLTFLTYKNVNLLKFIMDNKFVFRKMWGKVLGVGRGGNRLGQARL